MGATIYAPSLALCYITTDTNSSQCALAATLTSLIFTRHSPFHSPTQESGKGAMAVNAETSWPPWPEFGSVPEGHLQDSDFLCTKKKIIAQYGEVSLRKSWLAVCADLANVTKQLTRDGSNSIPSFDMAHLVDSGLSVSEMALVKERGCLIVRQVISEDEARKQYGILQTYVENNKSRVKAWPVESPSMLMLYDSPTQIAIRTHPNHLLLQKTLNNMWHDQSGLSSPEPLLYSDGIRDRPPGAPFLGLGPHVDAGSLCRWADEVYRKSYNNIFSGTPELHDCYDLGARREANQYLFPGIAHSRVFRSFQGWTALTPAAPRSGSILLYPSVRVAMAYILLRPFFSPPASADDILDAEKWTLDLNSAWFPGTEKTDSQRVSRTSHPHLHLEKCLVAAPAMRPGDSIWWHTDVSSMWENCQTSGN